MEKIFRALLFISLFALSATCFAAEKHYLVVNGLSKHFSVTPYYQKIGLNERNYGLGYETERADRWFYSMGWLKDSLRNPQPYGTLGKVYRYHTNKMDFDLKINGILSTRYDNFQYRKPIFALWPSLALGTSAFKLESTYIPAHALNKVALIYLQLKIGI